MLSARSDVEPVTVLDTCTVLPNTTLMSHAVLVMVSDEDVRSVTVPVATAFVPGLGEGAPGLGHAAPKPPLPPPAKPAPALPPVRDAAGGVVLALTLFWPTL